MSASRTRRAAPRVRGFVLGSCVAAVGCGAFAGGWLRSLDDAGLDVHFRYFGSIAADPRIVLIDVDDGAIRNEPWPWPRRRFAEIVSTLHELGAGGIALDVLFTEPHAPRRGGAALTPDYDVEPELRVLGDPREDPMIFDDEELRGSISRAGNVYLAMFAPVAPSHLSPERIWNEARSAVGEAPRQSLADFVKAMPAGHLWDMRRLYCMALIAHVLENDFSATEDQVVAALRDRQGLDAASIQANYVPAKRLTARHAARQFLKDHPDGSPAGFLRRTLSNGSLDVVSPDRSVLVAAYRQEHARRAVLADAPEWDTSIAPALVHAYDVSWPLDKLARAARGVGMVAYERTHTGAVLRSLPMLVETSSHVMPQLGFLVACEALGIDWRDIGIASEDGGDVVVGGGTPQLRMPVDRHGRTLLNWHAPPDALDWRTSFVHIPAGRVLEIAENRRAIVENGRRLAIRMGELVQLRYAETPAEYARYAELINERTALRTPLARPDEAPEKKRRREALAEMDRAITAIEEDATVWLRRLKQLWKNAEPRAEEERDQVERIDRLYGQLIEGRLTDRLDAANARLRRRTADLVDELRPVIEDRVCLVGATATGVADLVATPIHPALPGVMVHANVINTLLLHDVPARAALAANLLLLLLSGVGVAGVTAVRGPVWSLTALGGLAAVVYAMGAWLFSASTVHLATLPALLTMTVTWGAVTVYRQLTEARARRQLQQALARYTSPAVAARIVERIGVNDLAPQPAQATCFFCDLEGFTLLSERLGAERTRQVLNPYLGAVSDALIAHGAIVNKFMGDGVFAFFNTPIWPCASHAEAGCVSALRAVESWQSISDRADELGDARPPAMRVGLATGEVFVGDYGSDTKLDYTCIGDTVNVASRLEQANKRLGTTILVDERTRRLAGERFAARYLGLLEVEGRAVPVPSFELIGPAEEVNTAHRDYMARFAQAVAHYQSCEWDLCERTLQECRKLRSSDGAVEVYSRAVAWMRSAEPSDEWNRAVPLSIT